MRILPSTDFKVKVGEDITLTVKASDTVYQASISDLSSGTWTIVSPPNPEVRWFKMPDVKNDMFGIDFDFEPPAPPAKYHVTIVGDPAEDTFEEDISPETILPINREYTFVTT